MKHFFYLAVIAILGLTLSSCSKNNPATFSKQILGTWKVESQTLHWNGDKTEYPKDVFYTFYQDGTAVTSDSIGEESVHFQYSIKDGYVYMGAAGYQLSFEGNKMFWRSITLDTIFIKQ